MEESKTILSPCIRHCCLDKNDMCVGCFRTMLEIVEWSNADNNRRAKILENAAARKIEMGKPLQY